MNQVLRHWICASCRSTSCFPSLPWLVLYLRTIVSLILTAQGHCLVNPSSTGVFFIRSIDQGGVILTPETKSDFSGTDLPERGGNQSNILFRAILTLFKQNKYLKTFLGLWVCKGLLKMVYSKIDSFLFRFNVVKYLQTNTFDHLEPKNRPIGSFFGPIFQFFENAKNCRLLATEDQ